MTEHGDASAAPSRSADVVVAVDIGGTKMAAGLMTLHGELIDRDRIDSTRDVAPLKAAADAIVLDSEQLNADQVFEKVLAYCK